MDIIEFLGLLDALFCCYIVDRCNMNYLTNFINSIRKTRIQGTLEMNEADFILLRINLK